MSSLPTQKGWIPLFLHKVGSSYTPLIAEPLNLIPTATPEIYSLDSAESAMAKNIAWAVILLCVAFAESQDQGRHFEKLHIEHIERKRERETKRERERARKI